MLIITRKQAIAQGLSQYFTGKECIHGHVAFRYTQSGTCSACIAAAAGDTQSGVRIPRRQLDDATNAVNQAARAAVAAALAGLTEVRLRAYPSDVLVLRDTAAAVSQARYPVLREHVALDVVGRPSDAAAGTYLYRLRVPAEDVELMRETANALLSAHTVDTAAVRNAALGAALRIVESETQPLPDWTARP